MKFGDKVKCWGYFKPCILAPVDFPGCKDWLDFPEEKYQEIKVQRLEEDGDYFRQQYWRLKNREFIGFIMDKKLVPTFIVKTLKEDGFGGCRTVTSFENETNCYIVAYAMGKVRYVPVTKCSKVKE